MQNKTGIITLDAAQNYGSVFQAVALCKYLNDYYEETEVIRFTPNFILKHKRYFQIKADSYTDALKSFLSCLVRFPYLLKKSSKFSDFRKKHIKYSAVRQIGIICDTSYKRYVLGSDQIWNLDLTSWDKNFFAPFHHDKSTKCSYAASLGITKLEERHEIFLKKYLDTFGLISVREKVGCEEIQRLLPTKKISNNIDPVFLQPVEFWEAMSSKRIHKKPYVLIYTFNHYKEAIKLARKYSDDIDILLVDDGLKSKGRGVINIKGVGPKEFLSLIKNAELLLTDSFHGTAFAIIFGRQFGVYPFGDTSSRMENLLSMFGLENQMIDEEFCFPYVDYSNVNEIISNEQKKTAEYFDKFYKNSVEGK